MSPAGAASSHTDVSLTHGVSANTYFVAMVTTVGGMLFGFDISSMAAIVTTEQYIDYFDNPSGVKQGAIGSALAAGSVLGSLIAGPISDKWGRRDRYTGPPPILKCKHIR